MYTVCVPEAVAVEVLGWVTAAVLRRAVIVTGEAALDSVLPENTIWRQEVYLWQSSVDTSQAALHNLSKVHKEIMFCSILWVLKLIHRNTYSLYCDEIYIICFVTLHLEGDHKKGNTTFNIYN